MALPVLTIEQMRDWEKATWATGRTELEVIHRVGQALARTAMRLTRPGDLILILAGKGHNGDDARFAAEHFTERRIDILEALDAKEDCSKLDKRLAMSPALVIDGLFGIGINRPLSPDWVRFIERINAAKLQVLAVDVPSGLNADTGEPQPLAVEACVTLTVGAPKVGLLRQSAWQFVGRLEVTQEVGLVPCPCASNVLWTLPQDFYGFPSRRAVPGHKGTYGHAALLAGSPGYHGAAVLASRGTQRAQPGLITLYTLPGVYAVIASQLQAVMVSNWDSKSKLPENCTALMAGPGMASPEVPEELKKFVRQSWTDGSQPMIVDASALAWLTPGAVKAEVIRVITPHPGEAARLLGLTSQQVQLDRVQAVRRLSERFGNSWVILKGHQTLIGRSTGEVFVNGSGNPYLAQGGSGDLLSGYIAGLLAQPTLASDPLRTLRYAVWQHGACADLLQASRSGWVIEDLAAILGQAAPEPATNKAIS